MKRYTIAFYLTVILCGVIISFVVANPLSDETAKYESTVIDDKHYEGIDLTSSRFNEEVYLAAGIT